MAQGDSEVFDSFLFQVFQPDTTGSKHHFGSSPDQIMIALVDGTITPTVATADPHWGGTGGTDLSVNEVNTGGSYSGPVALANVSLSLNAGAVEIDFDDPAPWAADASNSTDTTWAIIFNNTNVHKKCIAYVDLGGAFNHTTGALTVAPGSPAIVINQAP